MVPGLYDPFGLSTGRSEEAKARGRSAEIKNGRLAMIGVAGMCSQEIFNHRGIVDTAIFYNKVFSGIDPYSNCPEGIDIC